MERTINTAAPTGRPLVQASNLTKQYGEGRTLSTVVDDVSLTIARGETLGLVGESGSGKSTVARMLLRLVEPSSGSVHFDGVDVLHADTKTMCKMRRRMQIVFQDPYAALNPRMKVRDILAEPFQIHKCAKGEDLIARASSLLCSVGLDGSALNRYPHEFSGGQRQRINIARAIALQPELLVLDEPVSALDVSAGAQIINLLRDLQKAHGLTLLFISHSMPLVRYLATRIAVMQRGRLVEIGEATELCAHPRERYTQQLIAATPELLTR